MCPSLRCPGAGFLDVYCSQFVNVMAFKCYWMLVYNSFQYSNELIFSRSPLVSSLVTVLTHKQEKWSVDWAVRHGPLRDLSGQILGVHVREEMVEELFEISYYFSYEHSLCWNIPDYSSILSKNFNGNSKISLLLKLIYKSTPLLTRLLFFSLLYDSTPLLVATLRLEFSTILFLSLLY